MRAGVGDDDLEAGGLGDDGQRRRCSRPGSRRASPGRRPPPTARSRTATSPRETPGRTRRDERPQRREDRRHAALHVARAAAVEPAVADRGRRTGRPSSSPGRRSARRRRGRRAGRARPGRVPGSRPTTIGSVGPGHLRAREVGVARRRPAGSTAMRSTSRPASAIERGHEVRDRLLRAGDARAADEGAPGRRSRARRPRPRPARAARLGRRGRRHPRRIGRVRQVGPPEPLIPISVAGYVWTSQPAAASARGRGRVALGHDHDPRPDREDVAAERRELLVRDVRSCARRGRRAAPTARPAGAAGRRRRGRRRPAR